MEAEKPISEKSASGQLSGEQIAKMRKIQLLSTSLKLQETERAYVNYKAEKQVEESVRDFSLSYHLSIGSLVPELPFKYHGEEKY